LWGFILCGAPAILRYYLHVPSEYWIDVPHRLVRARAWGVLTHAELTKTRLGIMGDPNFLSDFSQLYDFREVTKAAVSADEIREIGGHSYFSAQSRRAILAPHGAVYGLARMFELYREAIGGREQIRVFTSGEEAEAWLGLGKNESAKG
jgi:hypothetical protein